MPTREPQDTPRPGEPGFPVRAAAGPPAPGGEALRGQLIDESPDAILVLGDDGRLLFQNHAAAALLCGTRELPPALLARPWADHGTTTFALPRADGGERSVELRATRTTWDGREAAIVTLRDVSDRARLDAKLRQAQKMEALGRLAGGVAHDFNNILTVIMTSGELLRGRLPADSPDARHAAQIVKAAQTAAEMTHKLLTFSRDKLAQAQTLDVNAEITATLDLLRRLVGEHIEFRTELTPEAPQVRLAAGDLQQILINLVVNARDAMKGGGEVSISTSVVSGAGGDESGEPAYVGRYARIAVRDTGCGMDDETRANIFEPFFSTKGDRGRSGLGLATVYGIVRQADGHVRVLSRPGQGACFYVDLPLWDEAVAPEQPAASAGPPPPTAETRRVALVVEDQQQVRALVAEILEGDGFEVCTAEDGTAGVEAARRIGPDLALLVTDVMLPGTSGAELVGLVRDELPEVPIVVMSGYAAETQDLARLAGPGVACLPKPFTPQRLLAEVEALLR